MGQAFSSGAGNALAVHLDKGFYNPGDAVNGLVLLNCVAPFDTKALVLKVEGYEATSWDERYENETHDSDKDEWVKETRTTPRSAKKEFFKVSIPLQSYAGRVEPGQYQFPFSFVLPFNLPGSFDYKDSSLSNPQGSYTYAYTKAKIRYKVKAECEVPGMLKPNIRTKQHMVVHERMSKMPSEVVMSDTQNVTTCCCFGQGTARMEARVQKDSYYPGEVVSLMLDIDNQSSAEFSSVQLKLERKLVLKTTGAMDREETLEVAHAGFPGVGPNEVATGAQARVLNLTLPTNLMPMANGHLVSCQYRLLVVLKASAMVSDVKLKVPVAIYQAPPQYTSYTQPPSFWHPQHIAQPVALQLPSAPPMPPGVQAMTATQGGYTPPPPPAPAAAAPQGGYVPPPPPPGYPGVAPPQGAPQGQQPLYGGPNNAQYPTI